MAKMSQAASMQQACSKQAASKQQAKKQLLMGLHWPWLTDSDKQSIPNLSLKGVNQALFDNRIDIIEVNIALKAIINQWRNLTLVHLN